MSVSPIATRRQITTLRREPEIPRRGAKKARVHSAVSKTEKEKIRRVARHMGTDESSLVFANAVQDILDYHDTTWPRKGERR